MLLLSVGKLDTENHGRSTLNCDDLSGEMRALDNQSKSSFEGIGDRSNKLGERNALVLVEDVLAKLGNGLSIGLALKNESLLRQLILELSIVGDDSVMDDNELVILVRSVRMRVSIRRNSMSSPSGVSNSNVVVDDLVGNVERVRVILEGLDVSLLSDDVWLRSSWSVDAESCRVVSSVFESS